MAAHACRSSWVAIKTNKIPSVLGTFFSIFASGSYHLQFMANMADGSNRMVQGWKTRAIFVILQWDWLLKKIRNFWISIPNEIYHDEKTSLICKRSNKHARDRERGERREIPISRFHVSLSKRQVLSRTHLWHERSIENHPGEISVVEIRSEPSPSLYQEYK